MNMHTNIFLEGLLFNLSMSTLGLLLTSSFSQIQTCNNVKSIFSNHCCNSGVAYNESFYAAEGSVRMGFSARGNTRVLSDMSRNTVVNVRKLWGYDYDVKVRDGFKIDEATDIPYHYLPVVVAENDPPYDFQKPTRQCILPGTTSADSLTTDDTHAYIVESNDVQKGQKLRLYRVPLHVPRNGTCEHDLMLLSVDSSDSFGKTRTTDIASVGDYVVLLTRREIKFDGYDGNKNMPIFTKIKKADFGDEEKIQEKMGSSQMIHSYFSTYALHHTGNHVFAMGVVNLDNIDVTKDWSVTDMSSERIPFYNPDATLESSFNYDGGSEFWMSTYAHSSHNLYPTRTGDTLSGCNYLFASDNFVSWFRNQPLTRINVPAQDVTNPDWYMPGTKAILKVCQAANGVQWDYCVFDKNPKWGQYVEAYEVDDATGEIYIAGHNAITNDQQQTEWKEALGVDQLYGSAGITKATANWETHVCRRDVDAFADPRSKEQAEAFYTYTPSVELPNLNHPFYEDQLKTMVPDDAMFKGFTGLRLIGEKLYAFTSDSVGVYDRNTLQRDSGLIVPVHEGTHQVETISECAGVKHLFKTNACCSADTSKELQSKALREPTTCAERDTVNLTLSNFESWRGVLSAVSFGDSNWIRENKVGYCVAQYAASGCVKVYYGMDPKDDGNLDHQIRVDYRGDTYDFSGGEGMKTFSAGPGCIASPPPPPVADCSGKRVTIQLLDSYGDGWNDASKLEVTLPGGSADSFALPSGGSATYDPVCVLDDGCMEYKYVGSGTWHTENSVTFEYDTGESYTMSFEGIGDAVSTSYQANGKTGYYEFSLNSNGFGCGTPTVCMYIADPDGSPGVYVPCPSAQSPSSPSPPSPPSLPSRMFETVANNLAGKIRFFQIYNGKLITSGRRQRITYTPSPTAVVDTYKHSVLQFYEYDLTVGGGMLANEPSATCRFSAELPDVGDSDLTAIHTVSDEYIWFMAGDWNQDPLTTLPVIGRLSRSGNCESLVYQLTNADLGSLGTTAIRMQDIQQGDNHIYISLRLKNVNDNYHYVKIAKDLTSAEYVGESSGKYLGYGNVGGGFGVLGQNLHAFSSNAYDVIDVATKARTTYNMPFDYNAPSYRISNGAAFVEDETMYAFFGNAFMGGLTAEYTYLMKITPISMEWCKIQISNLVDQNGAFQKFFLNEGFTKDELGRAYIGGITEDYSHLMMLQVSITDMSANECPVVKTITQDIRYPATSTHTPSSSDVLQDIYAQEDWSTSIQQIGYHGDHLYTSEGGLLASIRIEDDFKLEYDSKTLYTLASHPNVVRTCNESTPGCCRPDDTGATIYGQTCTQFASPTSNGGTYCDASMTGLWPGSPTSEYATNSFAEACQTSCATIDAYDCTV